MKTNLGILVIMTILLYSCQNKSVDDEDIETDSIEISSVDQTALRKWLSFKRESDSIISSAELVIEQKSEELDGHPQDERMLIQQCIMEAQDHLDQFKKKVKYIKEYQAHNENFNASLEHTIDSLRVDYLQEKFKLETVLGEFSE
jgi:hypothetical protein